MSRRSSINLRLLQTSIFLRSVDHFSWTARLAGPCAANADVVFIVVGQPMLIGWLLRCREWSFLMVLILASFSAKVGPLKTATVVSSKGGKTGADIARIRSEASCCEALWLLAMDRAGVMMREGASPSYMEAGRETVRPSSSSPRRDIGACPRCQSAPSGASPFLVVVSGASVGTLQKAAWGAALLLSCSRRQD